MKNKILFNFRIPVAFCICFVLGLIISYGITLGRAYFAFIALGIYAIILAVFIILKKFSTVRAIVILFLATFLGVLSLQTYLAVYTKNKVTVDQTVIYGYLTDEVKEYEAFTIVRIRDLTYMDKDGKLQKLNSNASAYISNKRIADLQLELKAGSKFSCTGDISTEELLIDGVNTFPIKNNSLYTILKIKELEITSGEPRLDEKIRSYIKEKIYTYMDEENASIAVALVLGDKSDMATEEREAFSKCGIAHIFAVSGLHIGFIAAIFMFIIFKTQIHNGFSLLIVITPLVFYGWLCGFSPSVTRAILMTAVGLVINWVGSSNDMISSISISAILILLFSPLYIFDAGFLMSFGAVFGIATVTRVLNSLIINRRLNPIVNFILLSVFVSLGASLGTLPAIAYFYGEVSVIGVLLNVIVIPVVTIAFNLIMISLIPIGFFGNILWIADKIFIALRYSALYLSKLSFVSLNVAPFGLATLVLVVLIFVFAQYFNISKKCYTISCLVLTAIFALTLLLNTIPTKAKQEMVVNSSCSPCVFISDEGELNVVSDFSQKSQLYTILDYLKKSKYSSLNLFCLDYKAVDVELLDKIFSNSDLNYSFQAVTYGNNVQLDEFLANANFSKPQNSLFVEIVENSNFSGFCVYNGEYKILLVNSVSNKAGSWLNGAPDCIDVVYTQSNCGYFCEQFPNATIITNNSRESNYDAKSYGDFTISAKDGKIIIEP